MTSAEALIQSVRPTLRALRLTEDERARLLYDLVFEFYDFAKLEAHGANVDSPERRRIGAVLNAAHPASPPGR